MKNYIIGAHVSPRFVIIFMLIAAFAGNCYAQQLKFGDWECIEETDPTKDEKSKKIGTFAKDGLSSLWVSKSDLGGSTLQLTLKSKNIIDSEHFSYSIDKNKALTLSTASRTCESYCLTEYVMKNSKLIEIMKRSYRIMFEYHTYPEIANQPTFSLIGFTKAYGWLLNE